MSRGRKIYKGLEEPPLLPSGEEEEEEDNLAGNFALLTLCTSCGSVDIYPSGALQGPLSDRGI